MYGVEDTLVYLNEFPREKDIDSIGTFNGIATVKNNKVVYPMNIWQLIKYQHYLGIVPKVCYNDFIGYYQEGEKNGFYKVFKYNKFL